MARPFTATDDDILNAAELVMVRDGQLGFTLAAVAREVGLTRSAISIRFSSATILKKLVMDRFVVRFEEKVVTLNPDQGPQGLLAVADLVAQMVGGRDRLANFVQNFFANSNDPIALEMEEKRGAVLRSVLAKAMPETAVGKAAAIDAFMAHLIGSLLGWQARNDQDVREFLRERTVIWLSLSGINDEGVRV